MAKQSQTSQPTSSTPSSKNEGEGSRTAAERYNRAAENYVRSGRVDEAAKAAKRALEGSERDELESAEEEGKAQATDVEREADARGLDGEREGPDDDEVTKH
jgi:hypothetical protein